MLAVEGGSRMSGGIYRRKHLTARGIEGVQLISGSKPDVLSVKRDSMHAVGTRKWTVLTDNFGRFRLTCPAHLSILVTREWRGE